MQMICKQALIGIDQYGGIQRSWKMYTGKVRGLGINPRGYIVKTIHINITNVSTVDS
jgi:hypothetical protein